MKRKTTLILALTFGFTLAANAGIICEPLGNKTWACEAPYTANATYSWSSTGGISAGGTAPVIYASCSYASGTVRVAVNSNGNVTNYSKYLNCNSNGGY
jgi:hypothetical protein